MINYRNTHRRSSTKKAIFKNNAIFTGKHLYWSLFLTTFFNNFIKGDANTGVKLVAKLLRKPILKNICEWLLL